MSESDILEKLKEIAETYSTDNVIITTNEEQVHFERMDERGIMFWMEAMSNLQCYYFLRDIIAVLFLNWEYKYRITLSSSSNKTF